MPACTDSSASFYKKVRPNPCNGSRMVLFFNISNIHVCVNEYMSIEQGCYKAVMDLIDDNKPMAVGILVGIFLFQVQCINHGLDNN